MAAKTEQPTPKRLRDARRKGDVAVSRDLGNVLTFVAGLVLIFFLARGFGQGFRELFREIALLVRHDVLESAAIGAVGQQALRLGLALVLAVGLAVAAFGTLVGYAQVGPLITGEALKPQLKRLNPLSQLKNWFSARGLFELVKAALKLSLIFTLGYALVWGSLASLLRLGYLPAAALWAELAALVRQFLATAVILLGGLAVLDLAFQRWQWKKRLMMTKDEVKREHKEQEGEPLLKAERRSLHQEILQQDVVASLRTADAVVVNPTHLAVAVEYRKGRMAAPRMTAKGQGRLARKIVRLAERRGVPVVHNIPLARALFELRANSYVPGELYEAVAEVLLFAWKVRRESQGSYI